MDPVRIAAQRARESSYSLASMDLRTRNEALLKIAEALEANSEEIIKANSEDLEAARSAEISPVLIKRLRRDREDRNSIRSIHSLVEQEDVVGKTLSRPSWTKVSFWKISVPSE